MKIIFIHGGPGINCNPERERLAPLLPANTIFWNEPTDHFSLNLQSLNKILRPGDKVVANSFGAQYALRLQQLDSLSELILVSPDVDTKASRQNIFKILTGATGIQARTIDDFFSHVGSILNFYATDLADAHYFFQAAGPASLERFNSIVNSLPALPTFRSSVKTTVIFGANDLITTKSDQLPLIRQFFSQVTVKEIENSSHFCIIEKIYELVSIISPSPTESAPLSAL